MMYKNRYLILTGLLILSLIINSCKKETVNSIPTLLTTGYWQLGTVTEIHYLGDTQLSVDTIQCDSTQIFTFNKDYTCNYTNFNCNAGTVQGNWSLSDTRLYLMASITVPDSTGKAYQPFANAHLINVGEYSLVLETGDIQTYYTATDKRNIRRWGFVRIKPKTIH